MKNANKAILALAIFKSELQSYGVADETGNIAVAAGGSFRRAVRNRCVSELEVTWASSGPLYNKALESTRAAMAADNLSLTIATRKRDETHQEKRFVASKPRANKPAKDAAETTVPAAIENVTHSLIRVIDGKITESHSYATLQEAQAKLAARQRSKKQSATQWQLVVGTPDPDQMLADALLKELDAGGCREYVAPVIVEQVQEVTEQPQSEAQA